MPTFMGIAGYRSAGLLECHTVHANKLALARDQLGPFEDDLSNHKDHAIALAHDPSSFSAEKVHLVNSQSYYSASVFYQLTCLFSCLTPGGDIPMSRYGAKACRWHSSGRSATNPFSESGSKVREQEPR